MPRRLPAPNLTALLALSALGELIFYRVLNTAFLPARPSTLGQQWLVGFGAFIANLSGVLALLLTVVGLVRALGSDQVFPRSMRITVTTIGIFFSALATMGVLWLLVTPRYHVHLRISHGFLVLFLMLGVWHGTRAARAKVAVTLFALPMVLEAVAIFFHRMGWARIEPGHIVRLAHAITWTAMCAAPILLAPKFRGAGHFAVMLVVGVLLGAGFGAATALSFDVVQAVAFYGLRIDLTGLSSSAEVLFTGAMVVALSSLGAAAAACLAVPGPSRLVGLGLVLLAVSGQDLSSVRPALFTLCGLLALVMGTLRADAQLAMSGPPPDTQPHPNPAPDPGAGLPTETGKL
jgi:hypothetical protein